MTNTIIFIHGMFQNDLSWERWMDYFTEKGYNCIAEPWPLHEGNPADLRQNPPAGLGDLRLEEIVEKYEKLAQCEGGDAILVGHSVGGLIVQLLINKGLGRAGVCISSVAPNRMLAFDWGFFKNSISISNPFKGDEPFYMDEDGFYGSFANAMTREQSDRAYSLTAVHDSRNILRDCMLGPGDLDPEQTTKPLLFIGGEKDEIIPPQLNEKNAEAYPEGIATFKEFKGRSHFICGQPGWEEVAAYVAAWPVLSEKAGVYLPIVTKPTK
jgi:pimeloyl-ACP methyl ester carboxylesterase